MTMEEEVSELLQAEEAIVAQVSNEGILHKMVDIVNKTDSFYKGSGGSGERGNGRRSVGSVIGDKGNNSSSNGNKAQSMIQFQSPSKLNI